MILHDALLIFKHSCQPFFFFFTFVVFVLVVCVVVCDINIQRKSKWVGVWLIEMFQQEKNGDPIRLQAKPCKTRYLISVMMQTTPGFYPRNKPRTEPVSLSKGRTIQSRRSASWSRTRTDNQTERPVTTNQPINQSLMEKKIYVYWYNIKQSRGLFPPLSSFTFILWSIFLVIFSYFDFFQGRTLKELKSIKYVKLYINICVLFIHLLFEDLNTSSISTPRS